MEQDKKAEIGKRIQEIINRKGMSQSEFAELLLNDSTCNKKVSDWVRGVNLPKVDILIEIARIGEVTLDWLLTGREYSKPINIKSVETMDDTTYINTVVKLLSCRFPVDFTASLSDTGITKITIKSRSAEFMALGIIFEQMQHLKKNGLNAAAIQRVIDAGIVANECHRIEEYEKMLDYCKQNTSMAK